MFITDSGKLPYMAMLRNLRNLIKADIDYDHLEKIMQKLTNEVSVCVFLASSQY